MNVIIHALPLVLPLRCVRIIKIANTPALNAPGYFAETTSHFLSSSPLAHLCASERRSPCLFLLLSLITRQPYHFATSKHWVEYHTLRALHVCLARYWRAPGDLVLALSSVSLAQGREEVGMYWDGVKADDRR